MNTRSIAMIAILAVAAVAIVGAGYAAYWGQTTVSNNAVTAEYIGVETNFTSLNEEIKYNSIYSKDSTVTNYTIEPAGFITKTANTYGFETGVTGFNLVPITNKANGTDASKSELDGYPITLRSNTEKAAGSYSFNVKITNVTLGTAAKLYFAIGTSQNALPASASDMFEFINVGNSTYVADVTAPAITTSDGDYKKADLYYFIFADISGTQGTRSVSTDTYNNVKLADNTNVNTAAVKLATSNIEFQALVVEDATLDTPAATVTSSPASLTVGTHFTTIELGGYSAQTTITNVTVTSTAITITGTGAGSILLKISGGGDTFYKMVAVNIST